MKWKSDLFNNIVRMGIYLLLWGVSSDMVAQEDVKRIVRDSVRTSSEIQEGNSFSVSFLHEDFSVSDEKTLSFPLPQPTPTDSLLRLSLKKPLVLPYYTNPSPMFRGDYSTGGIIKGFENGVFYGSGEQTALPGIGLMNKASLGVQSPMERTGGCRCHENEYAFRCWAVFRNFGCSDVSGFRPCCL